MLKPMRRITTGVDAKTSESLVNAHDEPCYGLAVMMGIKASGNRKKMALE